MHLNKLLSPTPVWMDIIVRTRQASAPLLFVFIDVNAENLCSLK